MQITRNSGRLVGLLLLLGVITGAWGTAIRGLSGIKANSKEFLDSIVANTEQMKLAIGLDMLGSAVIVLLAIYLYPIIKKYSVRLAVAYTGIAAINFMIITLSNLVHWSLLSVGESYSLSENPELQSFTSLAYVHYEAYYWAHFVLLMCYAIGGSVLYYFLFKTQLVPKWIAVWGILAQSIVFTAALLQLMDISVSFYLFIQNGIFTLTLIAVLLAVGFRIEKYNTIGEHHKELNK